MTPAVTLFLPAELLRFAEAIHMPDMTEAQLARAAELARGGQHAAALEHIAQFLAPFEKAPVSVDAVQVAAVAVRLCNELSLSCMRDAASPDQLESAYSYLKWALKAPHASPALRAVTLNNAAIYYARTNNPTAALRCLERVGKQGGMVVEDDVSVHVTLNMTTVLADLGRHAEALEKAQEAVRMLTRAERAGRPADPSLLSAAYHNLAVQQERLGHSKGHVRSYRAAVLHARKGGAKSQPMASFMEQAYTSARNRNVQHSSDPLGASTKGSLPPVLPPPARRANGSTSVARLSKSAAGVSSYTDRPQSMPVPRKRMPGSSGAPAALNLDDVYAGSVGLAGPGALAPMPPIGSRPAPPTDAPLDAHAPRSAEAATLG